MRLVCCVHSQVAPHISGTLGLIPLRYLGLCIAPPRLSSLAFRTVTLCSVKGCQNIIFFWPNMRRRHCGSSKNSFSPIPGKDPIVIPCVRVFSCQDLVANGSSDPCVPHCPSLGLLPQWHFSALRPSSALRHTRAILYSKSLVNKKAKKTKGRKKRENGTGSKSRSLQ